MPGQHETDATGWRLPAGCLLRTGRLGARHGPRSGTLCHHISDRSPSPTRGYPMKCSLPGTLTRPATRLLRPAGLQVPG